MTRLLLVAAVALALSPAAPAAAQTSGEVQAGWWTSAPLAAPDVGEGNLLVQGGPSAESPLAYAAVSIPLGADEVPATLTLTVAPDSGTTPNSTLSVCPLATSSFEPAQGGSADDGPEYSCETSVDAAPSSDGSYVFEIGDLPSIGAVSVAVLPTVPTDRVVLTTPNADALATSPSASAGSSSGSSTGSGDTAADDGFGGSGDGGGNTTFDPVPTGDATFDIPDTPTAPGPDAERTDDGDDGAVVDGDDVVAQPVAAGDDDGDGRSMAPFLFGGLALAAGTLWVFAGQASDDEGEPA